MVKNISYKIKQSAYKTANFPYKEKFNN